MEYKKSMIILILTIFLVSIATVCASDANDTAIASEDTIPIAQSDEISVNDDNQAIGQANEEEIISEGNVATFSELQRNITETSTGTLELDRNYEYDEGFDTSGIKIDNSITIDGKGYTIDAKGKARVFNIQANDVTIKNLIIKNASYGGDGGAIYFSQSGSVINCNFTGNTASGDGGAIWMYSGSVENCNFTNNQATESYPKGNGGAIYFGSKGNVTNCNFTNNEANGPRSSGGAMYFLNGGDITNCNFAYNTAKYEGGAVSFYNTSTVTNCSFINNELPNCDGSGGAIYLRDGSIKNCKFINNSVSDNEPYISYSGSGGAIWTFFANIENCNFTNNTATGGCGAIDSNYGGYVTNCNFINNKAINGDSSTGALFLARGNVTNCNFINNSAGYSAGAINTNYDLHVINCNFTNNKVTGDASMAGAISMGEGSIENCNFINNSAADDAGAIYAAKSRVENCNFINNHVSRNMSRGGAISMLFSNVTNCNFTNNTANGDGGAIHADEGSIENCSFSNNRVTDDNSFGGAVYLEKSNVINCSFTNNTACYGGAVYLNGGNVANCSFTNNKVIAHYVYSVSLGGAIYFDNSGTVTTCKFINNKIISSYPRMEGGAIYGNHQHVIADTCIFKTEFDTNQDVIILPPTLNVDNFTSFYGSGEKITFDLKTNSSIPVTNGNISISLYFKDNNSWVDNYSCLSGEGWIPDLPVGSYYAIFDTEYAEFQPINRTIKIIPDFPYYVNVTTVTTNNKTVNITAKSNLPQNILEGKLLFIVPNTNPINATYAGNGTWWAVYTFADYGEYEVNATFEGLENVTVNNATISISKIPTNITVNTVSLELFVGDETVIVATLTPGDAGNVTFTSSDDDIVLVEDNGNVIANGEGQAIITVSFAGNDKYAAANKTINVTVKLNNANVTVDKDKLDLKVGETYTINATKTPDTILLDITYTSSNTSVASVDKNGVVTAVGEGTAIITVSVGDDEIYAENSTNVTVRVSKVPTEITALDVSAVYNADNYLIVYLKDSTGKALTGVKVSVDLNGVKEYATDSNGQVKVATKGLAPKTYAVKIAFNGNAKYDKSVKKVKVTVKKATPKIIAKKKTYKAKSAKKFKITLKDNTGKPIKNAKVRLIVKKIAKKAKKSKAKTKTKKKKNILKTNNKGKATFKVKRNKKGKYIATVKFYGNKYFKAVTKKVKITIK